MQAREGRVWSQLQALPRAALHLIYPPQCIACDAAVASDFGLCGACWRETPFISGLVCDQCGLPLPGQDPGLDVPGGEHPGYSVRCDECLAQRRNWRQGRAALLYRDRARDLVLQLKHGDRLDLARPAADWLLRAARDMLQPDMLVVPVPLHWLRLLQRRYNQAAILSAGVARASGLDHCPDLLQRHRSTGSQDGRDRAGRFANMDGAIRLHPRRAARVAGRSVLLIDDVMTSGATLSAAAAACLTGGAAQISVLTLCRVAKRD